MNARDGEDDLIPQTIPELIKHLWELYSMMSLDPALEPSAEQVKQAALTLERTRRLAFEVYREEGQEPARVAGKKRAEAGRERARANWLRNAKSASQLKH